MSKKKNLFLNMRNRHKVGSDDVEAIIKTQHLHKACEQDFLSTS